MDVTHDDARNDDRAKYVWQEIQLHITLDTWNFHWSVINILHLPSILMFGLKYWSGYSLNQIFYRR